ncbi:MAG TPA: regulatory protein GemA [Candidatus Defluviicoccus seviourii]|nr:regulatory protein GemA [Candidatus Defluviicoccus seviourii]
MSRALIAKVHIAKADLGLDDTAYRAVLARVTGKASSKGMSDGEMGDVLDEFKRLGWQPASPRAKAGRASGPYAKKAQALWIAAWNLGIVRSKDDRAMMAFVARQTGLSHARFLTDAADARKAIEALKSWIAREGGVDWSVGPATPIYATRHGYQIATAQLRRLGEVDPAAAGYRTIGEWIIARAPHLPGLPSRLSTMTDAAWITVMNDLGERLRKAMKGKAKKRRAA